MPVFTYKAMRGGLPERGTLVADSPWQARDQLRSRGLTIQDLHPTPGTPAPGSSPAPAPGTPGTPGSSPCSLIATSGSSPDASPHPRTARQHSNSSTPVPPQGRILDHLWRQRCLRLHRPLVSNLLRDVATLLAVGIPLLEAIDTCVLQTRHRKFRVMLTGLREDIARGVSLAEAMQGRDGYFDEITVQMVRVGESAGRLDEVLERVADFYERQQQFRGRVGAALLYPVIVLSVGVAVTLFLMTVVIPNLLQALIEAGQPLPLPTRIVKGASDLIIAWWWIGGPAVVITAIALVWGRFLGGVPLRRRIDHLILHLPGAGELLRKQIIARVAMMLAVLLENGVELVEAMRIVAGVTGNLRIRDRMRHVAEAIEQGRDIGVAMQDAGEFPPVLVQVCAVGQQTGELDAMLSRLADSYDRQVIVATNRLVAILEPTLIIFLAIIVGLIAFATILPIVEAGNVL